MSNKNKIITFRIMMHCFGLLAILMACHQDIDPIHLQQQAVSRQFETDKGIIINQLEEFYLHMTIPDSIRNNVTDEVNELLVKDADTTQIIQSLQKTSSGIYQLEHYLEMATVNIMVLLANNLSIANTELSGVLFITATKIDSVNHKDYWVNFIRHILSFSPEQARIWLSAKESSRQCTNNHDRDLNWRKAELYGAYGLQLLRKIQDDRLRLDILQRLQFILDYFYGFPDLSVVLAEYSSLEAENLGYFLRAAGIRFYMATSLHQQGETIRAISITHKLISFINKYKKVPFIDWYETQALILLANEYWRSGEYQAGLEICEMLQSRILSHREKLDINNTYGLIYRATGKYEQAEEKYIKALDHAESEGVDYNRITILENLGFLFSELNEYGRANDYFDQAWRSLIKTNPENYIFRVNLLLDKIDLFYKMSDPDSVEVLIEQVKNIIEKLGSSPLKQTQLLISLGERDLGMHHYQRAIDSFEKAVTICDANGLIHNGLKNRIRLARSLMQMGLFGRAKQTLEQTLRIAENQNALERIIDARANLAEIEYQNGNLEQTIRLTDHLCTIISEMAMKFRSTERLAAYQQSIYDYLKRTVYYEIRFGRIDSAHARLCFAKQNLYQLHQLKSGRESNSEHASLYNERRNLLEQKLILDYFLTQDSLYVFAKEVDKIDLFRKKVDFDQLQNEVSNFRESIVKTKDILNSYNPKSLENHYRLVTKQGFQLYKNLLSSVPFNKYPGKKFLEIIPDEYLYEIPFAALVTDTMNGTKYLSESYVLTYGSGFSFYSSGALTSRREKLQEKPVLISADYSIPGVKETVAFLKFFFSNAKEISTTNKLTKDQVMDELNKPYQIYIFIGHASANKIFPENSSINICAVFPDGNRSDNISLSLNELREINWQNTETILLVGCETGTGKVYRGAGIAGLQQRLVALGVENVLGSQWEIDARFALDQLKDFLQFWAQEGNPDLALQKTQKKSMDFLKSHKYFNRQHPYLWSGFQLTQNFSRDKMED